MMSNCEPSKSEAPVLFINGPIYPISAPALARGRGVLLLRGGVIEYVGLAEGLDASSARGAEVVDLAGRPLLPGLCDAHLHLLLAAEQQAVVDCRGLAGVDELCALVGEQVGLVPGGQWISGYGWEGKRLFRDQRPDIAALDRVAPGHPLLLVSKDLHSAWLNSVGLERLFALPALPAQCEIDEQTIRQRGLVFEDICELQRRLVPQRTAAQKRALLGPLIRRLHAVGITAVHCNEPVEDFEIFRDHLESGCAPEERLRVLWNFVFDDPTTLRDRWSRCVARGLPGWLAAGGVKLFLDGTFGSLTAAVSEPYSDGAGDRRGILNMDTEELDGWFDAIHDVGSHAVMHCIGDRAVAQALDGLRRFGGTWPPGTRHRLEHAQLLSARQAATGDFGHIAFSVQPSHMWGDREIVEQRVAPALGQGYAYAYRTMQRRGGLVVFGSDAPVEDFDPWRGIQAAVTRLADEDNPAWNVAEALTLHEALAAHTVTPANLHSAQGLPGAGGLAAGQRADLVVFDEDPFERFLRAPTSLERGFSVAMTYVDGELVFRA
jgi:predicted amidohydrolase YtcJ